ncbi:alcohol o-acetyltransferase 1-related [Anaeramoeba flamelloides]|uniref:Alcohol o-acetyltransferase 1-related n=1 Tax=Anaeramoeba flamelloides TaxID=1746091 RepID=A0ABQ8XUV1_9EUKA|nr:alcohol o-acetyltransferase 1-related [Anaeramoeba flamelloides]
MSRSLNKFEKQFCFMGIKMSFNFVVKGNLTLELINETCKRIYEHQPILQKKTQFKKKEEDLEINWVSRNFEEAFEIEVLEKDVNNHEQVVDETLTRLDKLQGKKEDCKTYLVWIQDQSEEQLQTIIALVDHLYFDARSCLAFVSEFMKFLPQEKEEEEEKEKEKEIKIKPLEPQDLDLMDLCNGTTAYEKVCSLGYKYGVERPWNDLKLDHLPPLNAPPKFETISDHGYTEKSTRPQLHFKLSQEETASFIKKCKSEQVTPWCALTTLLMFSIYKTDHSNVETYKYLPGAFVDLRARLQTPLSPELFGSFSWVTELEEMDLNPKETKFWQFSKLLKKMIDAQLEQREVESNVQAFDKHQGFIIGVPNCSSINNYGSYDQLGFCKGNEKFKLIDIAYVGHEYPMLAHLQIVSFSFNNELRFNPLFSRQFFKREKILNLMSNYFIKGIKKIVNNENDIILNQF